MLPGHPVGRGDRFAASLGEFGATITFVSNVEGETRTLPLAIYSATQTPGRRRGRGTPGRDRLRPRDRDAVASEALARRVERAIGRQSCSAARCARGPRRRRRPLGRRTCGGGPATHDDRRPHDRRPRGGHRAQVGDFVLDAAFTTAGGVTALFGTSGAGKTTIAQVVAGILRPDAGRVVLGGETLVDRSRGIDVPIEARGVGYVFQDARLFPHLSVERNLRYGLARARGRATIASFDDVVGLLALGTLLARRPRSLSRRRATARRARPRAARAAAAADPRRAARLARRRPQGRDPAATSRACATRGRCR